MAMLPGFAPESEESSPGGDSWYTPGWLLAWLPPIALDPCWSAASLVKAAAVLDLRRGDDGLRDPWQPDGEGIIFCNPPFSDTSSWLRRCRVQAEELKRVVVALVPALPGDGPWHNEVWPFAYRVGFIAGRVDFVDPRGRTETKGRGHALVVYGYAGLGSLAADIVVNEIAHNARQHPQRPVWTRVV